MKYYETVTAQKIKPSEEYINYLQEALVYAIAHGFKVKVFNTKGELIALQG